MDHKLAVPFSLQNELVREHHSFLGHVGFEKLWDHMKLRFEWSDEKQAQEYAKRVLNECECCQACQPPLSLKAKIHPIPIPPQIMTSVAIDLFDMPKAKVDDQFFDLMAVCVDRHSGWVVAVPVTKKGLTGEKVAKEMLKVLWRPFGIPSIVTSDQGSHFVSNWWQTLCANLGIRLAYAQAYHHQANGRAERAGKQIIERARKVQAETKINWVEALPQILDRHHDTPGEGGYSPYEILFGRERPFGGLPYKPPRESEDCLNFIQRMKKIDQVLADTLNIQHQKQAESLNRKRKDFPRLKVGDKVWYLRPENSGTKIDSRWLGPAVIVEQNGDSSYHIKLHEKKIMAVPTKFLKPYVEDTTTETPIPLFFHKRTTVSEEGEVDEFLVEKIVAHKVEGGKLKFLVKWEGYGEEEQSWETADKFLQGINGFWRRYCEDNKLKVDLVQETKE